MPYAKNCKVAQETQSKKTSCPLWLKNHEVAEARPPPFRTFRILQSGGILCFQAKGFRLYIRALLNTLF
jgi:hypothetical protein